MILFIPSGITMAPGILTEEQSPEKYLLNFINMKHFHFSLLTLLIWQTKLTNPTETLTPLMQQFTQAYSSTISHCPSPFWLFSLWTLWSFLWFLRRSGGKDHSLERAYSYISWSEIMSRVFLVLRWPPSRRCASFCLLKELTDRHCTQLPLVPCLR